MKSRNKHTDSEFVDFERVFLKKTSLVAVFISFVGLFINLALDFGIALYIIPAISMVVYGLFYFFVGSCRKIIIIKWFFVVITFVFLNLLWFYNYGSNGPAPYFFILIYSLFIFIFSKKQLIVLSVFLVINIAIFFFLDIYFPDLTNKYDNEVSRITDVYTGLIFYTIIVFVLINNAKVNFVKEYHKAKISDNVKTNFLHNISHEIRTPLNAIVGFSTLICDESTNESDKEEYIKSVDYSTQSLLKLVNEIIDASQLEAGSIELFPEKIDINKLLIEFKRKTLDILSEKKKTHLDLKLLLPEKSASINFDKERFEQLFLILLDNAIKFTSRGKIEIGYKETSSKQIFWVSDTGIGIKDEFIDKVFHSFLKHEKSNAELYRGTGIGLFLAKSIVNLNGGTIWLESTFGQGTTAYFSFPKIKKHHFGLPF